MNGKNLCAGKEGMEEIFNIQGGHLKDLDSYYFATVITQLFLAILAFTVVVCCAFFIGATVNVPRAPVGSAELNYEALQGSRKSFQDYCQNKSIDIHKTPMVAFNVATANFGSIFTEKQGMLQPWTGSVSAAAARLQVEGGARAIIFDIWPDPADHTKPVVCSMLDHREWATARWWRSNGLNRGTSNFSNWRLMTRNKLPAGEALTAATNAAFTSSPGTQNTDPFFMILNLHGAMSLDYLNLLGSIVQQAVQGYGMAALYSQAQQQDKLYNAPVSDFMNRVFVIVVPDIDPSINSLPGVNNWTTFKTQFLTTTMGQVTNAIQYQPNQIAFDVGSIGSIATPSKNCVPGGPALTPAQAGFCMVQPTIGGSTNDNTSAYSNTSWVSCLQSGAQFVGINMFSTDAVTAQFFDPAYFGTWSFKKGA